MLVLDAGDAPPEHGSAAPTVPPANNDDADNAQGGTSP
jgi:hypothetical protein